jgi:fatty acid CoA ligase FadD9
MSAYPIQQRTPTPREPSKPLVSCRLPLEGCSELVLDDLAPAKWTAQSTASPTRISGYTRPTEAERSPYWAIDLGQAVALERIEAWIVPTPKATTLRVFAYTMPTLGEGAPQASLISEQRLSDLPLADDGSHFLELETFAVARFVRVELHSEGLVVLALLGARIYGVPIYAETLAATYARAFTLFADRPLFAARRTPGSGPFEVTHTYRDLWLLGRRLARSFAFHLERENPSSARLFVGLALPNGPEWLIGELAALFRGYVVVPLSPEEPADRLLAIVAKCPLDVVLCTKEQAATYASFAKQMPRLRLVVVVETPPETVPNAIPLAALLDEAPSEAPAPAPREPDDLHTLLFTSGSTGAPKGAMRSYRKFAALIATQGAPQPAVHLSFQPLSHASERHYLPTLMANGALMGIGAGGTHLLSDLRALEPTWVSSVPRLFDVVRAGFERKLAAKKAADPSADATRLEAELLRETRLVFGKNIQGVSTGSAPVSPETLRFMKRCFADLWVFDGYGSTEVGTIAANERVPLGVDVKLGPVPGLPESDERGEILVRSPYVIDGYFGDGEASARAVTADGFFHTGDLGERTEGGGIRVVGRITSTRKLGQGELVCVDRIEADLGSARIVDRLFVHPTPSSTALVAVVVPRIDVLADALGAKGTLHELCAHADAPHLVLGALRAHGAHTGLLAHELPSFVVLEPDGFTTENGLLTPSGKLSRREAAARYEPRFAALDQADETHDVDESSSLLERVVAIASRVTRRRVNPDEPLGDRIGQDSLATAEILAALSDNLGAPVPLALWFRASTLRDLATLLDSGARPMDDTAHRVALDLELPLLDPTNLPKSAFPARTILLTGATGLLGAHLLESLVRGTDAHVLCLARAKDDDSATARIAGALAHYGIVELDPRRFSGVAADLAAPGLGLGELAFSRLCASVDTIVHAGADVNWLKPYASVRLTNVLGTATLVRMASTTTKKAFHYVSTISTAPTYGDESTFLDESEARAGSGYALSKWVAEALVRRAARLGLPVAIHRPGMITGHHERARGNRDDFVNRYLRACMQYGLALDRSERLDMTPVDYVSQAITAWVTESAVSSPRPTTTHLCNMHASPDYRTMGHAIAGAGVDCRMVDYATFRTGAVLRSDSPLRPLASYFPASGFVMGTAPPRGSDAHEPWPSERTRDWLGLRGIVCPIADENLVEHYVRALKDQSA